MAKALLFGEVLEGIETLSLEDQEILKEILHRRIVERRREELVQDVQQAQQEFQAGQSVSTRDTGRTHERDRIVTRLLLRSSAFVRAARRVVRRHPHIAEDLRVALAVAG